MGEQPPRRDVALPWHRRLDARVALALAMLVAGALGAMFLITTQLVSTQSRSRAEDELDIARAAFASLMENRAASSTALATLVTELPVFRAHLTDARLAADRPTIDAMADGYRRQLDAHFVVVTNSEGTWLASPGWGEDGGPPPAALGGLLEAASNGTAASRIIERRHELFLAVSVPARFADEVLGTLTAGYRLTDGFAEELARLAQCEVVLIAGTKVAASSLKGPAQGDAARLVGELGSVPVGVLPQVGRVGEYEYVGGIFPLGAPADGQGGRLLLLADWQPTKLFVDRLRGRFLFGGLVVFGVALAGGVMVSRRVSRPLRDIAAAAADIAGGNLARQLPERGSAEDITVAHAFNEMSASLRAAHKRLIHDAIHDPLTLLPNRVLFMERLERAMARRVRHPDYHFAVLFIDLDRFKHVNDSLGHTVGDQLLFAFSERLASVVRHDDTVTRVVGADADGGSNTLARFGGDEFVMLIDDISDPIDAVRVAERVHEIAARSLALGPQEVFVSTSIGVAVCSPGHATADDVIRDADLAMYRAKSAGGGRYVMFDAAMHQEALERLRLETELRRAVDRHEFSLWYQPIVSLGDGRVVGVEALVRWQHPERGLLDPGAFLHVAEELGVIAAIDLWALGEACRQGQQWRREHADLADVTVSVNLSAKGFGSDTLVPQVIEVLEATGFPARGLRLEITESVAMADADRVRSVLTQLRALGVRVSLDDFGTGYCSLSYLQQFPVDTLKIDRSFVARIGADEGAAEIIRLIVGLAHTLGLDVVAEGTETAAHVDHLAALGCGYAQGYFFARPSAPAAVEFSRSAATKVSLLVPGHLPPASSRPVPTSQPGPTGQIPRK